MPPEAAADERLTVDAERVTVDTERLAVEAERLTVDAERLTEPLCIRTPLFCERSMPDLFSRVAEVVPVECEGRDLFKLLSLCWLPKPVRLLLPLSSRFPIPPFLLLLLSRLPNPLRSLLLL